MTTILDQIYKARRVGTPLIAIATPDPAATIQGLREKFEDGAKTPIPLVQWDAARGFQALNKAGLQALTNVIKDAEGKSLDPKEWAGLTANPGTAALMMQDLPGEQREGGESGPIQVRGTMVFALNLHRYLEDRSGNVENGPPVQAVWNLRDAFKQNRRTLILLGPGFKFPPEIAQDIIVFDEPLPEEAELRRIVTEVAKGTGLDSLPEETVGQAVDAVRALPAFTAEQVVAMSSGKESLDIGQLWERKIKVVEQTPGLSFNRGTETYDDVGGLEFFKRFSLMLARGKNAPLVYVTIDEVEKMLAGIAGDNTGVSQDTLGVLLREMEDNDWIGMLLLGHAGCGKTLVCKSLANTASQLTGRRVLSLNLDLGATKAALVGQSEQMIRAAMKTLRGLAGKRVCFLATCNNLDILPPAFRRRFRLGTWVFDLPLPEERDAMWAVNLRKYGLDAKQTHPDDTNWTPADIRNVCDAATRLSLSLVDAAKFCSVPIAKSDPEGIDQLRRRADGRFLSANYEGPYKSPGSLIPVNAPALPGTSPFRRVRGEDE